MSWSVKSRFGNDLFAVVGAKLPPTTGRFSGQLEMAEAAAAYTVLRRRHLQQGISRFFLMKMALAHKLHFPAAYFILERKK